MKSFEKIYYRKENVAIVIRKNFKPKDNIHFFTSPKDALQVGFHSYKTSKTTNIHTNKVAKPVALKKKNKYIYLIKGSCEVNLISVTGKTVNKINLSAGDSIIIFDIAHKVVFSSNSKVLEIKQGPYDKK
jgi:hypothetical protein